MIDERREGAAPPAARSGDEPALACHPEVGCISCGDEGVEARVVRVDMREDLAVCVDEEGSTIQVDLGIVGGVAPGDALLVHAGVALTRLERSGVA